MVLVLVLLVDCDALGVASFCLRMGASSSSSLHLVVPRWCDYWHVWLWLLLVMGFSSILLSPLLGFRFSMYSVSDRIPTSANLMSSRPLFQYVGLQWVSLCWCSISRKVSSISSLLSKVWCISNLIFVMFFLVSFSVGYLLLVYYILLDIFLV